jgi:hypothetical protein
MNMLLKRVSQIGSGPGSWGMGTVSPSTSMGVGSVRSSPVLISYGTALKA